MLRKSMLIVAATLVAASAVASTAEARDTRHRVSGAAAAARAQVPPRNQVYQPQAEKVFEWGKEQGQDPDPNVRLMLRRDVHN